ncbi:MAG: family 20 glycosylhydrolase [Micromonosporaceae bacterium]|nr:family 20 glycosylhydrolase [Micromonosporaceae bacterium]
MLSAAIGPSSASAAVQAGAAAETGSAAARPATTPSVVPAPASLRLTSGGAFSITRTTEIVVRPDSVDAVRVGEHLASLLRPSTGYPVPVTVAAGPGPSGAIILDPAGSDGLGAEGYTLTVDAGNATLTGHGAQGLFRAAQTLRQLLPPTMEADTVQPGPWAVPGVEISDAPRFGYRGAMLDVSRHFFSVDEVRRYIDLAAMYKINVLHLHLSDDQGWRIAIDSWPRLATYGGSTEVGGGPGGYYTKADYASIVAYAAERYITVVPEIDMPGHTNAALASYAELNCDGVAPPLYTGTDVGFSSLCIDKAITYDFVDDVIAELAAMTPGDHVHMGGDEAHATTPEDYQTFLGRVFPIVGAQGKRVMGWQEIAAGPLPPGAVTQYWGTGDARSADLTRLAVQKGARVVMSPANRAYLDMKYNRSTPYGLTWAGYTSVKKSYAWDPASQVAGVGESDIAGVEAPLWSETIDDIDKAEFMAYPRLPGIAEIGWSPASTHDWNDYRNRLADQGPRWDIMGVDYYRAPDVPWR